MLKFERNFPPDNYFNVGSSHSEQSEDIPKCSKFENVEKWEKSFQYRRLYPFVRNLLLLYPIHQVRTTSSPIMVSFPCHAWCRSSRNDIKLFTASAARICGVKILSDVIESSSDLATLYWCIGVVYRGVWILWMSQNWGGCLQTQPF